MCYMSVVPHGEQAEESIDVVFMIDMTSNLIHIDADIAWSTGEILGELLHFNVPNNDVNALDKIDLTAKAACEQCQEYVIQMLQKLRPNPL